MTQVDHESATAPRQPLRVSVVLPVYGRPDGLKRLLSALVHQSRSWEDAEVLVCDDGSREDLATVVAGFEAGYGLPIRYLRQSNQGAGAARNLGLGQAQGEIVAFTDSDCEPDERWLAELLRPFDRHTVGIVGGLVDYRDARQISGRCVNFLMSSTLGAAGARDPRSAIHMRFYPRAGNLAVRRRLALAVGGFPTSSHGEDLEFSHKVLQLGVDVEFVAAAKVVHDESRSVREVFFEAAGKGMARVRLAKRHGMHEFVHAVPALLCVYLAALGLAALLRAGGLLWWSVPGVLYGVALGILAVQGAIALRSVPAGLLMPLYAVTMHLGYGLGYLYAAVAAGGPVVPTRPIDGRDQ